MKIEAGKYYKTRDGQKVGPMVDNSDSGEGAGYFWRVPDRHIYRLDGDSGTFNAAWHEDGLFYCGVGHQLDLTAELIEGPVRTVTRKEIVQGRFGIVSVGGFYVVPDCSNSDAKPRAEVAVAVGGLGMVLQQPTFGADELRAAAATFIELADALDEVA